MMSRVVNNAVLVEIIMETLELEEVFKQCTLFKPQPQQIKLQIENLIEREFLNRDPAQRNVYHYLP